MTKEQFFKEMAYYANSHRWRRNRELEKELVEQWRAFDPKLAAMLETASASFEEMFRYIEQRMG